MKKKILIIDDDHDFIEAISMFLEANGYEIVSTDNGADGIAKARQIKPDLMILDVMMSQVTEGFDTARAIKKDAAIATIPIILVTGIKKEMNLAFGFEPDNDFLPVQAVLEKPIHPEALLKTIQENLS